MKSRYNAAALGRVFGWPDEQQVRRVLAARHQFASDDRDAISVWDTSIESLMFGVMNIMFVSVTERTREIGIRKALGASRANILLQFLIEAVVLCLFGGLFGVTLGGGGAMLLNKFANWNADISPSSVVMSFVFAALVGVLFGVWPARRAAQLDPIVALRYE